MAKNTGGEGQGTTKNDNSCSAEAQNATRRATKARRNHGRSTGNGGGESLFSGIYADRRQVAEERRVARDAEAYNFRVRQSEVAMQSVAITTLKEGSIAHKAALLVIEEFPLAEAYHKDGVEVSRTTAAAETALERLSDQEIMREKAVKYGISAARTALRGAYAKLKDGSVELTPA